MYKRAFLAVQYQTENHVVSCSGMADSGLAFMGDATIISLAWCSEVRE